MWFDRGSIAAVIVPLDAHFVLREKVLRPECQRRFSGYQQVYSVRPEQDVRKKQDAGRDKGVVVWREDPSRWGQGRARARHFL
jgi:hypothetical protein